LGLATDPMGADASGCADSDLLHALPVPPAHDHPASETDPS